MCVSFDAAVGGLLGYRVQLLMRGQCAAAAMQHPLQACSYGCSCHAAPIIVQLQCSTHLGAGEWGR